MLNELTSHMLDDWGHLFPSIKRPAMIRYLGIPGSVEGGTTTFLAFDNRHKQPFCSVKVHRHSNEDERARNEYAVLQRIQSLEGGLAPSVPRSILIKKISGHWILVQTILDGVAMAVSLTAEGKPDISHSDKNMGWVIDWLIHLHDGTADKSNDQREKLLRRLSKMIGEFVSIFDLSLEEKKIATSSLELLQSLSNFEIPIQHGDFCRQNILVDIRRDHARLNIIDWTDSQPEGCPFHDLFCFMSSYFLQVRKTAGIPGFVSAFEDTFLSENSLSDIVKKWILRYSDHLGWAPENIRMFMMLFLMEQSVFEYRKLMKYSVHGGLPRFTLTLASTGGKKYQDSFKEQLWIYFFHVFANKCQNFIL